jgi:hypothetical protein
VSCLPTPTRSSNSPVTLQVPLSPGLLPQLLVALPGCPSRHRLPLPDPATLAGRPVAALTLLRTASMPHQLHFETRLDTLLQLGENLPLS